MSFQLEMMVVTPKIAEKWLNENTNNRPLRSGIVEKYGRDMVNKAWGECIDPIAFYDDGTLADGQHRLWAIMETQVAQKFIVVHGVKKISALNIDNGVPRSYPDNAKIVGRDGISTNLVSCVRFVEWGTAQVRPAPSYYVLDAAVKKHFNAAHFAVNRVNGRGIRNAPISAAIARAWYVEQDKEKLSRFCEVVSSGFSAGDHESAAIAIRNAGISMALEGIGSLDARVDLFRKCQNAIKYFMRGKKLTVIRGVSEEAYPLMRV